MCVSVGASVSHIKRRHRITHSFIMELQHSTVWETRTNKESWWCAVCTWKMCMYRNALARFHNFTFDLRYACTRLSAHFIFIYFNEFLMRKRINYEWIEWMNEKNRVENLKSNRFVVVISVWCSWDFHLPLSHSDDLYRWLNRSNF